MRPKITIVLIQFFLFVGMALSATLKVGDSAPVFRLKTQDQVDWDLMTQKGRWTILYFYPKADTPGCTKQAKSFSQDMDKFRKEKIDVVGISADEAHALKDFQKKYGLEITLLADPLATVIGLYGTELPLIKMSKRWTFILDPDLKIRHINQDVDPEEDATSSYRKIKDLQQAYGLKKK